MLIDATSNDTKLEQAWLFDDVAKFYLKNHSK